ncbi:DUF4176 domain-containing protein [Streptococcus suis]
MSEKILPIGTIVSLQNGDRKLMITARYPLYNNEGRLGYFDYAGCLYPDGNTDNRSYFFNDEDIAKVNFLGFSDEEEQEFKNSALEKISRTNFVHFKVEKEEF